MSPLGKLTLALLGIRLFGADGLLVGLFLGHILIDKTFVIRKIEVELVRLDDVIRIKLPYKYYRYYNRLDGNIWGKLWGGILGSILFGFWGFVLLFVAGQVVFDMPQNADIRRIKKKTDHFFDNNWGKILGAIIGFVLESPVLIFIGLILGFMADYQRLEEAKLIPFEALSCWFQKINPLKLWRHAQGGEHRRYLETMAALAALTAEADNKGINRKTEAFAQIFAVKWEQESITAKIFKDKNRHRLPLEKYADMLEKLTRNNDNLKEVSLENLFKIAVADGLFSAAERQLLKKVAQIINLDNNVFARLEKQLAPKPIDKKLCRWFDVLGLPYDAGLAEVKAKWKKLIVIYHPDKLGTASDAEVKIATERMAEINLAYQEIVKAKGRK